jgi:hypothetical protein
MISVIVVIAASVREWVAIVWGDKVAVSTEIPYEPAT